MSEQTLSSISTQNSQSSNSARSIRSQTATLSETSSEAAPRRRKIGRWFLGETLGKGGYSWVKKGYDRKTGQAVALKFMDKKKSSESYQETQTRQVRTEIEALKQIQHPNILRLLAYNLNARYPERTGVNRNVILLVLEYMPGGELFDILYYSAQLEENVARTYFRQLIDGIEACHQTGICHRDIKPQNLLLNEYYQLKITDFGLAKIFDDEKDDETMLSFHVGTRGYQAPEILERRPYTTACDVFSAGVVLFILLTGYPPFEHAKPSDKWYRPLTRGSPKRFWKNHHGCGVSGTAKDLITRMFSFDPAKRMSIADIRNHPWYNNPVLPMEKLAEALRLRHRMMEVQRRNDPRKQLVLQGSNDIRRQIPRALIDEVEKKYPQAPLLPMRGQDIRPSWFFTTVHAVEVLEHLRIVIQDIMQGRCMEVEYEEPQMKAEVRITPADTDVKTIVFFVRISYSEKYDCNVVKFMRMQGGFFDFKKVLRQLEMRACAVLTGLPSEKMGDFEVTQEEMPLLDEVFYNWRNDERVEDEVRREQPRESEAIDAE